MFHLEPTPISLKVSYRRVQTDKENKILFENNFSPHFNPVKERKNV